MELKILSPQESGFVKEIRWNHEELKAELTAKMQEYKNLVFTEETIGDAKKDRANLNKLKNAFEDERKRIKKLCMEPYTQFEKQCKELVALVDEPIALIAAQIKEVEEQKKAQKRKDIEELFFSIGFQNFVSLDLIWNEKWLNASVPISKVEEQLKSEMYRIGDEVYTIQQLKEFSFEAMEVYKKTLDLNRAIQEGQRLSDIQKRKKEYEEEQRRKREEEKRDALEKSAEIKQEELQKDPGPNQEPSEGHEIELEEQMHTIDFRVTGTTAQISALKQFLVNNNITYGPVPKKGE